MGCEKKNSRTRQSSVKSFSGLANHALDGSASTVIWFERFCTPGLVLVIYWCITEGSNDGRKKKSTVYVVLECSFAGMDASRRKTSRELSLKAQLAPEGSCPVK